MLARAMEKNKESILYEELYKLHRIRFENTKEKGIKITMKHFDFTPIDTKISKGVEIILMIIHHQYNFPKRINFDYVTLVNIGDHTIEFLIG